MAVRGVDAVAGSVVPARGVDAPARSIDVPARVPAVYGGIL